MHPAFGTKLWIAVRFVLCGVGGFLLMLLSWFFFINRVLDAHPHSNWRLALPSLMLAGAFLALYGVGQWGRWAYVGVFLTFPLSTILWALVSGASQDKATGPLLCGVVTLAAYYVVRGHYEARS
jgi:hypothetical protein